MFHRKLSRWSEFTLPLWGVLTVMVCVAADPAAGCPNCKESVAATGGPAGSLAAGYFASILLLLGMPVMIGGVLGGLAWLAMRRAVKAEASSNSPPQSSATSSG